MKKELKTLFLGFIFLNGLIVLLALSFLIPNKMIYTNLKNGAEYYKKEGVRPNIKNLICTMKDSSADSTELNIIMNNDAKDIISSVFYTRMYRDFNSQNFMRMSYDTIVNNKEANYNYNRYWHGYQLLWRPLLILFNVNIIRYICLGVYSILLGIFIIKSIKMKYIGLGVGMGLMNIFHIIPFGFNSLEYIPVFLITIIMSLLFLYKKGNPQIIFLVSGISVAFFDFWTSETLTFTVPCVVYAYLNNKKGKFRIKENIYGALHWLGGYCGAFVYKWGMSSLIYKENFFKIALDKYGMHTVSDNMFSKDFSIKYNINVLLLNKTNIKTSFIYIVIFIIIAGLFIYLFRKKNSSVKYILTVAFIGCIPYIRYFIFKGHSREYVFFTYRAQLVIILILTILFCETSIRRNIMNKKKKATKKKGSD